MNLCYFSDVINHPCQYKTGSQIPENFIEWSLDDFYFDFSGKDGLIRLCEASNCIVIKFMTGTNNDEHSMMKSIGKLYSFMLLNL